MSQKPEITWWSIREDAEVYYAADKFEAMTEYVDDGMVDEWVPMEVCG